MRIIAGECRGMKLKMPDSGLVRPTQDKVKGAIFNILGDKVIDARVLDLYCGSGALGIEALSRGAESCVFIDRNIVCVRDNLESTGLMGSARIIRGDAGKNIFKMTGEKARFDIILADPPYNKGIARNLLSLIKRSGILSNSGFFIVEHSKKEILEGEKFREKKYGDTVVSIFINNILKGNNGETINSDISRDI